MQNWAKIALGQRGIGPAQRCAHRVLGQGGVEQHEIGQDELDKRGIGPTQPWADAESDQRKLGPARTRTNAELATQNRTDAEVSAENRTNTEADPRIIGHAELDQRNGAKPELARPKLGPDRTGPLRI